MRALARTLLGVWVLLAVLLVLALLVQPTVADPSRGTPTVGMVALWPQEGNRLLYVAGVVDGLLANGYTCSEPRGDVITEVLRVFPTIKHSENFRKSVEDMPMPEYAVAAMQALAGCRVKP